MLVCHISKQIFPYKLHIIRHQCFVARKKNLCFITFLTKKSLFLGSIYSFFIAGCVGNIVSSFGACCWFQCSNDIRTFCIVSGEFCRDHDIVICSVVSIYFIHWFSFHQKVCMALFVYFMCTIFGAFWHF